MIWDRVSVHVQSMLINMIWSIVFIALGGRIHYWFSFWLSWEWKFESATPVFETLSSLLLLVHDLCVTFGDAIVPCAV